MISRFYYLTILLSCCLAVFVALTPIHAQEKKWSVEECMRYAVENSLKRSEQEYQNSIYKQEYLEAIGRLLPSINAGTSAYFNFGRGLDAGTNSYVDVNSFTNNYELYTSLPLFSGFSNITRIRIQKVNQLAGAHQLQEIKDMTAYETMEIFFMVLYHKKMIELSQEQLDGSKESLKQVMRMEELGVKSFPDVTEMQAKEAADNYNLTRQKNLFKISLIQLKEKMNFPLKEELDINDSIPEMFISKTGETALHIFEQSTSFLPKALSAESAYQSQRLNYRSAKGGLFPQLSLNAGISTNFFRHTNGGTYSSFSDQFRDKRGSYVGVVLSIPIFNNFSRSSNLRKSKYQLSIAENEKESMLRSIYSEIEQAVADMNGQADVYYQAKKQAEAMNLAHQVNRRKYNEGLISPIELHTSENRLFEARIEEVNAQLQYQLKYRLVNYYKGQPFITE